MFAGFANPFSGLSNERSTDRFEALDSLRGLCACAVVFYHLASTGLITNLPFFRNSWLFVDFFFVLSGFVIAASYWRRLEAGFSIKRFMVLRLGRIYPMHFAMLLAYLALECLGYIIGAGGFTMREPFTQSRTVHAFVGNLFLMQSFGLYPTITWNEPSWSIAVEMWTYLLVALTIRWSGLYFKTILVLAAVISPIILLSAGNNYLQWTFSWSIFRCIYSFSLGMITYWIYSSTKSKLALPYAVWSAIEAFLLLLCWFGISKVPANALEFALPIMFAGVIFVFSKEQGWFSRAATNRPFVSSDSSPTRSTWSISSCSAV